MGTGIVTTPPHTPFPLWIIAFYENSFSQGSNNRFYLTWCKKVYMKYVCIDILFDMAYWGFRRIHTYILGVGFNKFLYNLLFKWRKTKSCMNFLCAAQFLTDNTYIVCESCYATQVANFIIHNDAYITDPQGEI